MIMLGIRVYALGALALGLVGLAWDDFALQWQPVPAGVPGRAALAYVFAAALVAVAVAVNLRRAAAVGAAALCGLFALVVLLHAPEVVTHPLVVGAWSGLAQIRCAVWRCLRGAFRSAPGSRPRTPPPPPASSAAVPSSSAGSAVRCRSLPAPSAGAPSASLPPRRSSRCRTRTLFGSVQTAPPLLSNPTSSSARGYARIRVPVRLEGGPKQTAELGQFRIPKSSSALARNVL